MTYTVKLFLSPEDRKAGTNAVDEKAIPFALDSDDALTQYIAPEKYWSTKTYLKVEKSK